MIKYTTQLLAPLFISHFSSIKTENKIKQGDFWSQEAQA